jgi:hypothetical protein
MSEPTPTGRRLQDLVSSVSSVIAPITLISAVLFYFGYVYTTTEYAYFGLDVDTIGLSTQEFIMRSPQALLTPLLGVGLVGAAVGLANGLVRGRVAAAADAPWRLRRFLRAAVWMGLSGRILLGVGAVMVVAYGPLRTIVPLYELVTPAMLAIGAALAVYGLRMEGLLGRPPRRAAALALYAVLATSLLWATATLAQYGGRGAAITLGRSLTTERPAVVLDTKERLYLNTNAVREVMLPTGPGEQAYRYRYRNLRLLIQGKDRLFLVPSPWSRGEATLVLPLDDAVRIQFVAP